ncbi:MAG: BatA domain-containing protein, partial [Rhodobacteraceae bacterium]|nr:BatA domain-containing protein [Paracoccaceae bacterium]
MTAFGTLAFLQPAFLAALIALPILWWLLRVSPPAPRRVRFPGVQLLLDLVDRERTPDRTPWWLLLLRMLALAALIFAFAQPVLNPKERLGGSAPVTVVMDGGWASAPDWPARRAAALEIVTQAREAELPVALINLSDPSPTPEVIEFRDAETQSRVLAAAEPYPWRPDPSRWLQVAAALEETDVIWLHDGLDEAGAAELAEVFGEKGALRLIEPRLLTKALAPPEIRDGALVATVARATTDLAATSRVAAIGRDPNVDGEATEPGGVRRLAAAEAVFEIGGASAEAEIDLPPQLRNALARIEIVAAGHAGAAALLDDRWRRRTVALVSGERSRSDQPLLSGVHYLRAALDPHADYRESSLVSALGGEDAADLGGVDRIDVEDVANAWADVIILSDIGRLDIATEEALIAWVERGGLLVRFAGPQLAAAAAERSQIGRRTQARGGEVLEEDPLLPTRLRGGGRALGGALSWAAPQSLQPFPGTGPFAGLGAPEEATVTRQVLAEPGPELSGRVWAALADGTPLVTSKPVGEGRVVLFHVTASAAWSTLPLSGLFVDMMGRLVAVAPGLAASAASLAEDSAVWKPETLMDAYGELAPAPDDATPVAGADLANGSKLGVAPGIYVSESGDAPTRLALSATPVGTKLSAGPEAPDGAVVEVLSGQSETALKPWLLALGLLLLMIDSVIAIMLAGGFRKAATAAALMLGVGLAAMAPTPVWAQNQAPAETTTNET